MLSYSRRHGRADRAPGHGVRLLAAHAARRLGQHVDHAGADQRPDHRVRRRPDPPEHPHRGHHRPLHLPARPSRDHRRLQCRLREHLDPRYRRAHGPNIPAEIVVTPSNDPRSYRVNSDRLLGRPVSDRARPSTTRSARSSPCTQRGALKNEDRWHNLRWMEKGRREMNALAFRPRGSCSATYSRPPAAGACTRTSTEPGRAPRL